MLFRSILNKIRKIYDLYLHRVIGDKNPFLNYIPLSNYDQTFIQYYYNGSDYFEHHDGAILTILYVLYDKESKFDGGEFVFTKYRYKPYLTNNCCIIFPSYEIHKVEKIFSEEKEKPVRYSINQRIWIK